MPDRITANLLARDMNRTASFYAALGFRPGYRDAAWMILNRGPLEIEFFAAPDIDPWSSWHSACVRVDDLDGLYADFRAAGLSEDSGAIPRLTPPVRQNGVPRLFALVDENGSLLRCLENG